MLQGALRGRKLAISDHRILTEIRLRIMEGQLHPGAAINLSSVAEDLVVSLAPVRDALLRLSERGLVCHFEGKGFFVASPSPSACAEYAGILLHILEMNLGKALETNTVSSANRSAAFAPDQILVAIKRTCTDHTAHFAAILIDQISLSMLQTRQRQTILAYEQAVALFSGALSAQRPERAMRLARLMHKWLIHELVGSVRGNLIPTVR
jgi:DNA-binding transcriptional regulator YhcF (GntR family)